MGILAFIIGLGATLLTEFIPISVMKAFNVKEALEYLPLLAVIAFLPALTGLILGVVALSDKKNKKISKSIPVLGIVLSGCSILVIILFSFILVILNNDNKIDLLVSERVDEYMQEYYDNSFYDYEEDEYEDYYFEEDDVEDYIQESDNYKNENTISELEQ